LLKNYRPSTLIPGNLSLYNDVVLGLTKQVHGQNTASKCQQSIYIYHAYLMALCYVPGDDMTMKAETVI
jgi:hypothetical protein